MRQTTVSVYRGGEQTKIASGLRVQVDQLSFKEMAQLRAYNPRFADLYRVYTLDWNANTLLRRTDILVDDLYTDEENANGAFYKYRVVARPKNYDFDHQECTCEVVIGN